MATSGVATEREKDGSSFTAPEASKRSASSSFFAQPSCRQESTAALSIGRGGCRGSASGGPACSRTRPSRPIASRAWRTAVHCGRTAAMRVSAPCWESLFISRSMLRFIQHRERPAMKSVWNTFGIAISTMFLLGTAAAQEPIKIGVTQPLTGAFAASGNYVAQGAKIAEEQINAAGGVLGRKIQLVIEDNKSNPTEAVATAEKLIAKDKVPVMMGAWSSTLTLAIMPKLMEYEVPMLVETSSSGKITTAGNPWIFRISPTSEMEARAFGPMVKSIGIQKADFLSTNNDFGLGAAKEFSELLKKQGVKIGVMETMDPKATDFSA